MMMILYFLKKDYLYYLELIQITNSFPRCPILEHLDGDITLGIGLDILQQRVEALHGAVGVVIELAVVEQEAQARIGAVDFLGELLKVGHRGIDAVDGRVERHRLEFACDRVQVAGARVERGDSGNRAYRHPCGARAADARLKTRQGDSPLVWSDGS